MNIKIKTNNIDNTDISINTKTIETIKDFLSIHGYYSIDTLKITQISLKQIQLNFDCANHNYSKAIIYLQMLFCEKFFNNCPGYFEYRPGKSIVLNIKDWKKTYDHIVKNFNFQLEIE